MSCWHCESNLIWGGDHSYEDYGAEGEGIVSNLSCPNEKCGVEAVYVYYKIENNVKENNEQSR